jgi:hypothetical protein
MQSGRFELVSLFQGDKAVMRNQRKFAICIEDYSGRLL